MLSDIRQILNCESQSNITWPSHVFYIELGNENPDSDETISLIAEDLLDKFSVKGQDGYILLVVMEDISTFKWT